MFQTLPENPLRGWNHSWLKESTDWSMTNRLWLQSWKVSTDGSMKYELENVNKKDTMTQTLIKVSKIVNIRKWKHQLKKWQKESSIKLYLNTGAWD